MAIKITGKLVDGQYRLKGIRPVIGVEIIYPERRWIPARTIHGWYEDAVANDKVPPGSETLKERAYALQDAGLITLKHNL